MADLIPYDFNFLPILSSVMFYLGYVLLIALIMGVLVAVFLLMQYKIKAETFNVYGAGNKGQFSIGKSKMNRLKKTKDGNSWKPLFPLFNKNSIEPFEPGYVYPGNRIKAFIYNDDWVPAKINISGTGEMVGPGKGKDKNLDLKAEIGAVPHYIRNWQSMKHKEHAQEFSEHNFWEDNKYFFMVIGTAALCLVMVGVTIYFTYNFATGGADAMNGLAGAIRNFNVAGGVGPN